MRKTEGVASRIGNQTRIPMKGKTDGARRTSKDSTKKAASEKNQRRNARSIVDQRARGTRVGRQIEFGRLERNYKTTTDGDSDRKEANVLKKLSGNSSSFIRRDT